MELKLDLRDAERAARRLGAAADQLPFAFSLALNDAAVVAKEDETDAIQSSFDRPIPFTQKAIGMKRSTKRNLTVEVFVKTIQTKYLDLQVHGGTRRPNNRALPVPGKAMRLNKYGNMPRGAVDKRAKRADTFTGRPKGRPDLPAGIWKRTKRGLKLLVLFTDQEQFDPRFDFYGVFEAAIRRELPANIRSAVSRAMSTRRRTR
ncbi:MAG: hypothetical protein AAGL24_09975 [Pseudomonadota bacterium]